MIYKYVINETIDPGLRCDLKQVVQTDRAAWGAGRNKKYNIKMKNCVHGLVIQFISRAINLFLHSNQIICHDFHQRFGQVVLSLSNPTVNRMHLYRYLDLT